MNHETNNGRTLASLLAETKEEVKHFFATRIALFRAELREKGRKVKSSAPLAFAGLLLLGTAYVLFTLALVGLVLALLPANPYRWCFAFLAVAVLWTILGAPVAWLALRRLAFKELVPNRTINVLKGDGIWLQTELRNRT